MRILIVGDVVGRPGRRAVHALVPQLRQQHGVDLVIANGENAAGGAGLTPATADELLQSGIDVITSGNHIWAQKDIIPHLDGDLPLLRPLNYPPGVPGRGYLLQGQTLVINLMGRLFMTGHLDCPFRAVEQLLADLTNPPPVIIVDFHAEATSEKVALGWYLDGKVSAVLGTHTHVGTVDARLLPNGTAYVSDVGMVGAKDSVIGVSREEAIRLFLTQLPPRLSMEKGDLLFNSVLVEIEEKGGRATGIIRLDLDIKEQ